jgi:hypothetical protein
LAALLAALATLASGILLLLAWLLLAAALLAAVSALLVPLVGLLAASGFCRWPPWPCWLFWFIFHTPVRRIPTYEATALPTCLFHASTRPWVRHKRRLRR